MKMIDQIRADLLQYRKDKYKLGSKLLQTFLGDLDRLLLEEITDDHVVPLINKYVSNANEVIAAGRNELLIESAKEEIALLQKYLPNQLTADEIVDIIHDEGLETGLQNVGKIMKFFKENYLGQYDNKVLSDIAKS